MAFNEKEQEIIKYGLENGKSQQEVMSAIAKMRSGIIPKPVIAPVEEKKPNYFQRVGQDYKKAGERITTGIQTSAKGIQEGDKTAGIEAGLRTVGSIAGATFAPILEAPGIKQATEAVVGGAMKIPVVQTLAQKGAELSQKYPNASKDIEDLINIATLGIGSTVEKPIANAVTDVAKGVKETAIKTGKSISTNIGKGVEKITPDSATIMNRVARLKPTDAKTFENLAGKTHGDYLVETGNFGTPDQIITKEAEKFAQSIKSVDKALASLPGTYKNGGVDDMLNKLMQRGLSTSTENVKAPYLAEVMELSAKNKAEGLSMSDINNVKRLYERHEKLGYNKMLNAKEVEQATYIDNAVREWQVQQAEKLGFTNLKELNKQTQLSRFIVNKLGDQVVGQSGLNGVGLTDWIMLSGGDPTAVGAFLTKKFFSSKGVQAKVAELMNTSDIKVTPTPKVKMTPEGIERSVSPMGLKQLPVPKEGTPKSQVNVQINQPSRKAIEQGTEIVPRTTPSKPTTPPLLKKESGNALPKSSPKSSTKSIDPLINEAKKYKSAEEFVKAKFEKPSYGMSHRPTVTNATADNITQEVSDMGFPKDFYSHPEYYEDITDKAVKESLNILRKVKGNPDAEITIYRASPKNKLNIGDWVTLSKKYATGESLSEGSKVYSYKVKAKDIQFAGDSINEFGYYPKSQLTDIWNQAQGSKIDPLFSEAKKYKSAEEFVKKQQPITHYTSQKFDKFDLSKTEAGSVWFTDNPKIDLKTGQGLGSAQVGTGGAKYKMDRYINPKSKIIDIEKSDLTDRYTTGQLIDMGYSGVKVPQLDGSNWYEIWEPNKDLLTKSQLEEIWKKANNKK